MENYSITERLDALLEFIVVEKDNHGVISYYKGNYNFGIELSDKFDRDGYIKRVTKTSSGLTQVDNTATIEGRLFYAYGGYKQKQIDDDANRAYDALILGRAQRNEVLIVRGTWVASIVGFLLLLWQIFLYFYPVHSDFPYFFWQTVHK